MISEPEKAVESALAYASRGWPVFPCQPGGKAPATRHGFRDATTDPEQIRRLWERQPAANVAIATGAPGPDVLDIDQRGPAGNGFAAYNQLKRAGLLDGAFAIVATPGGGLHAYFTGSIQPSGSLPARHLDFKAKGGYVVAPPSRSTAGNTGSSPNGSHGATRWTGRLRPAFWTLSGSGLPGRSLPRPVTSGTWPPGSSGYERATGTLACSGPRAGPLKPAEAAASTTLPQQQPGAAWTTGRSPGPSPRPGARQSRAPELAAGREATR